MSASSSAQTRYDIKQTSHCFTVSQLRVIAAKTALTSDKPWHSKVCMCAAVVAIAKVYSTLVVSGTAFFETVD